MNRWRHWSGKTGGVIALLALAGWLAPGPYPAQAANGVGYAESFEAYTNGFAIVGTNGWGSAFANSQAGVVTTNPAVVAGLADYANAFGPFPVPAASHSNVLQLTDALTNGIVSATGGVVVLDFLAVPSAWDWAPTVSTNWHYAFGMNAASNVALWHYDAVGLSNRWTAITNGPVLTNGVWARFTVVQDYAHGLFQLRVNNGTWLPDALGWGYTPAGSLAANGPWFYMARRSGVAPSNMTTLGVAVSLTNYLDDLVLTNRQVAWSANGFTEGVTNNGTFDAGVSVGLLYDTFAGTDGQVYGSAQCLVSNVPAGLAAVVTRVNATNLSVTLSGQAAGHESANSVSNLWIVLQGAAFALSNATDVAGSGRTNLVVTFLDTPRLAWTWTVPAKPYFDSPAALNGGIDPATALTVTLTNATFNGTVGEDFATNAAKLTVANLPSNLTAVATLTTAMQVSVSLTGQAQQFAASNTVTDLTFTFLDGAFSNTATYAVPAASVVHVSTNATIQFHDPDNGNLIYSPLTFTEAAANDGRIGNTVTLMLDGASFANTTYQQDTHYTVSGVPAGLTFVLAYSNNATAVASLTNAAGAHAAANGTNLVLTLKDAAFSGITASNVFGSVTNLAVVFHDPPSLAWGGTNFTEAAANDGSVATVNTVTLSDPNAVATFVAGTWATGAQFAVSGVPAGLTCTVTQVNTTTVQVTLAGNAAVHLSGNNTGFSFQFLDGAFTTVAAADISGCTAGLAVVFHDPPSVAWSGTNFTEAAANDGSIATTNTVTLSDPYAAATFVGGAWAAGTHYTVSGVPGGLTCAVTRVDAANVQVTLAGKAAAHAGADGAGFSFQFLDGAFTTVKEANITGVSASLAVAFHDPPSVAWSGTGFAEAAANDGSMATTNTVTLSDPNVAATFAAGTWTTGTHYTVSGVPAGLACAVTRVDAATVRVALAGNAAAHAIANNAGFAFLFLDGAFTTVAAANVAGSATNLSVSFRDPPSLAWSATSFAEAVADDGSLATTNTVTLSDPNGVAAFAGGAWATGVQYAASGVPDGLTAVATRVSATSVTVAFGGHALAHAAADSASVSLQFLDAAFTGVAVPNVLGTFTNVALQFVDPARLTYSTDTFNELSQGTIDNSSPMLITLAGDAFTGTNGSDFVADHKLTVANLPAGLAAVVSKASGTQLSVQLTGRAYYNDTSVTDLTFQFGDGAFSNVAASLVVNAARSDLRIVFVNDTPFTYTVPYREAFEDYANGFWMPATNGWTAEYPEAGVVTAEVSVGSAAHAWQGPLPLFTNHLQTLYVQSGIQSAIQSVPGATVYLDFMVWPTPMQDTPQLSPNQQFAFYVTTNSEFVLWHQNRTGGPPTNEARVLTNAPPVDSNRWMRVAVCQDYSNAMFRVRLNNGAWLADDAGWSGPQPGGTPGGSWFYMVQTNGYMSRFGIAGAGSGYVDDLTVGTNLIVQVTPALSVTPVEFHELQADNGAIDNTNSNRITLAGATFAGNVGDVLGTNQVQVANLPANLAAVLTVTSPTNLSVRLTGHALSSDGFDAGADGMINDVDNLGFAFLDGAFTLPGADIAGAANVAGASQSGLKITFINPSGTVFKFR